jgi:hypothetical protein
VRLLERRVRLGARTLDDRLDEVDSPLRDRVHQRERDRPAPMARGKQHERSDHGDRERGARAGEVRELLRPAGRLGRHVLVRLGAGLGVELVHLSELGHGGGDRRDEGEQRTHDQDAVGQQEVSKPQMHGGDAEDCRLVRSKAPSPQGTYPNTRQMNPAAPWQLNAAMPHYLRASMRIS